MALNNETDGKRLLSIFDEGAEKSGGPFDDFSGRFRAGYQDNGMPRSSEHWIVTSGDPELLDKVASLYGGTSPEPWETKRDDSLRTFTSVSEVPITLTGIDSSMVLFTQKGLVRMCDGIAQKDGTPCACPSDLAARKAAANEGTGCKPQTRLFFTLKDLPDARWVFETQSWNVARDVNGWNDRLLNVGGAADANLSLKEVSWTTKQGQDRSFIRADLKIHGPAAVLDAA